MPTRSAPRLGCRGRLLARTIALLVLLACSAKAQTEARIALRWGAVREASQYQLQIATDRAFADLVVDTRVSTSGYRWNALPTRPHFWRVRSIDAAGRAGDWSQPEEIAPAVSPPRGFTPRAGAELPFDSRGPAFTASPQPTLERYVLELARDPAFTGAVLRREGSTPELTFGPLALGAWFWRWSGLDVTGRPTGPGPVSQLIILPDAPRLSLPAGELLLGPDDHVPPVSWSVLSGATHLRVEFQTPGAPPTVLEVGTGSFALPKLQPGRHLVRARATEGSWIGPATVRAIVVRPPPPTALTPPEGAGLPGRQPVGAAAGSARAPPASPASGSWMVDGAAGVFTTFGALTGPSARVGVSYASPWLGGRMRVGARIGTTRASVASPFERGSAAAAGEAWLHHLDLLVGLAQPLGPVTLSIAAGPSAQLVDVELQGVLSVLALRPGLAVAGEVALPWGPGEVLLEATASTGALATPQVLLRTGGVSVQLGYRVVLR